VSDGTSTTFLFGERSHRDDGYDRFTSESAPVWYPLGAFGLWAGVMFTSGGSLPHHLLSTPVPINYEFPPNPMTGDGSLGNRLCAFGSLHPGGANFAFTDGSVRFVSDQTRLDILQALSTRAGGVANWLSQMSRFRYASHKTSRRESNPRCSLRRLVVEKLEDRCLLTYSITDLGTLPGPLSAASIAVGINNQGQVVGSSGDFPAGPGNVHGFLWDAGVMTDLGTLGGRSFDISEATGINDQGQVVGDSSTGSGKHAFLWETGSMTDLGTLPGYARGSEANAINNAGQVVGSSYFDDEEEQRVFRAFLWQDGVMADLGTLAGAQSAALGINEMGQVVGELLPGWSAFVWDSMNGMQALEGWQGPAQAINNQGQVVGSYRTYNAYHGALWEDGTLTDLGVLSGDFDSFASAINIARQVVGWTFGRDAMGHDYDRAFLWQDGVMSDLNSLVSNGSGWTLESARGINDAGQIVGFGTNPDRFRHAYLLTPDGSPHLRGRFPINLFLAQTVSQPQVVVETVVSIPVEQPRQQAAIASIADAAVHGEATSTTTPIVLARHGQDAVFAGWRDLLVDSLALSLLG
jgi:prepilin-type processing-associated H-X9-DG protein